MSSIATAAGCRRCGARDLSGDRAQAPRCDTGAAYSSDLGGSGTVTWTDHNLFGSAEELDLTASVINLNGSATNGIGYDTGAKLIVPEFLHPAQTLQFSLDALKQSLVAYDQTAETAGLTLTRTLSKVWSASVGFTTTQDTINQPQEAYTSWCPMEPWRSTEPEHLLLHPVRHSPDLCATTPPS